MISSESTCSRLSITSRLPGVHQIDTIHTGRKWCCHEWWWLYAFQLSWSLTPCHMDGKRNYCLKIYLFCAQFKLTTYDLQALQCIYLIRLALFSDFVWNSETEAMIAALKRTSMKTDVRRVNPKWIPEFQAKTLSDFVTERSINLFTALNIDPTFLHCIAFLPCLD